jgi:hypothetical protein
MTKLDVLAKEYHNNIQKRRVYDLARKPYRSVGKYSSNNAESPIKQMVNKANQHLNDFTIKAKAKSQAKLNTKPLSPQKNLAETLNTCPDKESPLSKKLKNPLFELSEGKNSKSFRIIEFKDRKKI